jgi:hypothetical protein
MKENKNKLSIAFVIISFFIIIVLIYLLINCKKKDTFCTCRSPAQNVCPDRAELIDLYDKGILTENSDIRKMQGETAWKIDTPYDQFDYEQRNQKFVPF